MPKPTKGPRLGGGPAHERLLLANLAAALYTHKSIKTTETKAKRLRPLAERLITFAKRGDLHARRRVLSVIGYAVANGRVVEMNILADPERLAALTLPPPYACSHCQAPPPIL